jgi:hypothetical protein
MPSLFVLVSTGQAVANLPPVLEHARTGDFVLWVESAEARRSNWTEAARAVLEDRGLVTAEVISVEQVNDPFLVSTALSAFAADARGQYDQVFVVANGGNKLSPIGVLLGLAGLNPELLYGDDAPAVCSRYTNFGGPPTTGPFTKHDLDLPDILRLNGYVIHNAGDAARIWPDAPPSAVEAEPYGRDENYTYQLHADHDAWAKVRPADDAAAFPDLPGLAPDHYQRWKHTVEQVQRTRQLNPQILKSLYHSTLNLDKAARKATGARGVPFPAAKLGDALERAVARRAHHWLAATRHPAVQSAWLNVVVAREATPHQPNVDFDVLLVLCNGVLIHLECKSAEVDVRDLDARMFRLQRTSSRVARLAVVLPLFTRQAGAMWFNHLCDRRYEIEQAGLPVLPFTWPAQPAVYNAPAVEHADPTPCPTFEAALENLLARYRMP